MPQPKIWPHDIIRELLALANANGEASATLASNCEAKRFRYAIYTFRRKHGIGEDLILTVVDNEVIVRKREMPQVHITQEQVAGE